MVVMLSLFLNRYGVMAIPEIRCRLDLGGWGALSHIFQPWLQEMIWSQKQCV